MASEIKEESNSTSSDIKTEDSSDETKKVDNEIKDDKVRVKTEVKEEIKEEIKEERSDDDDEEDSDESEDEEVALLDRPVEVTGCRARKKVERLEVSFSAPKEKQEIPEGKGDKLGDCPGVEAQIQRMKPIDLKPMHRILFSRIGSMNEIKKNIRKFSGFPFEKGSPEFNRKKASVEKLTATVLKQACGILEIERSGTKEEIVTRIMNFLLNPHDTGKRSSAPKKKASKDKKDKKSSAKKVKSEKKGKSSKEDTDDDAEESVEDDDDDSTGGEASMGGTDEEAEALLTEPKKKSKETKKIKPKAEKAKKEDKKQKATKRKRGEDEKSSGSSDEEPGAKRKKMPSDEEISKLVKQILESADLQEITMKKVIKQVSDAYPGFDLSHKKAFIKSTIKSIL